MTEDYADEEQAQQEALKLKRDQELDDIRVLLKHLSGRRFFARLLSEGKVFSTTFSTDASAAAFLEGHRNLALKIFNDVLEASPELIPQLLTEGERHSERI